ncbi:hypothetical protein ACS0TY_009898 [Phlomoides rotata]
MFGFRKSAAKQTSADVSDSECEEKRSIGRRTSSEPALEKPNYDNMSVQELEKHAVNQSQETTKSVNNCLRIAEDIRQDATKTLETLHQQGDQIHRTHVMAADMDKDLTKGEKLLNNLGGMFSMSWKPKKTKHINGPKTSKGNNFLTPNSLQFLLSQVAMITSVDCQMILPQQSVVPPSNERS